VAFCFDNPTVEQGNVADNGKTEARASGFTASASIRAVKAFKNPVLFVVVVIDKIAQRFAGAEPKLYRMAARVFIFRLEKPAHYRMYRKIAGVECEPVAELAGGLAQKLLDVRD